MTTKRTRHLRVKIRSLSAPIDPKRALVGCDAKSLEKDLYPQHRSFTIGENFR